ncbi:transglutaminase-like domain-containing protein [uncultured Clostridium sp.]|uniref:transglutaminase-like domain-containing protein n=1 Tax=uncultured Clostridium sp. TaxID=59620 RepID=UPI0026339045|nr:transglutaminase-like domain-containing protein [uncultured Clostridium sp.]
MKISMPTLLCLIVVLFPTIIGAMRSFRRKAVDAAVNDVSGSLSLIGSIIIFFNFFNSINNYAGEIASNFNVNSLAEMLIKLGLIILAVGIIHFILYTIFRIINKLLFYSLIRRIEDNGIIRFILSTLLGFIKGILTLIIIFIIIIIVNKSGIIKREITSFDNMNLYQKIEKTIDIQKISEIKSGILKDTAVPTIVYYNGTTLNQGVKSDAAIDEKAREITSGATSNLEKARMIYDWVGSHITYDDKKAEEVMAGNKNLKSGAIVTFNTRRGICFDYACLYVAMARAVDLPVRLITGEAYNGQEYISHAWNQVYIKSLDKWINVDPTFYDAGNYFNNKNFFKDHKEESIAGQWD